MKQLPTCIEIEKLILSSFFYDKNIFLAFSTDLQPEMFYLEAHKEIFTYMVEKTCCDVNLATELPPPASTQKGK